MIKLKEWRLTYYYYYYTVHSIPQLYYFIYRNPLHIPYLTSRVSLSYFLSGSLWFTITSDFCSSGLLLRRSFQVRLGSLNVCQIKPLLIVGVRFLQARCPSCHPTNSIRYLKVYLKVWYFSTSNAIQLSPNDFRCCCTISENGMVWFV